eukprot:3917221-Rhodomonas_salina.1
MGFSLLSFGSKPTTTTSVAASTTSRRNPMLLLRFAVSEKFQLQSPGGRQEAEGAGGFRDCEVGSTEYPNGTDRP